ncbi:MAG: hypothetical protein ACOX05_00120 [Bacillota bacterium]|jgi:hypothetical protein
MICPWCKQEIPDDSKYCPKCAGGIKKNLDPKAAAEEASTAAVPAADGTAVAGVDKANFKFGVWPKIWFILCTIGGFINVILGIILLALGGHAMLLMGAGGIIPAGAAFVFGILLIILGLIMSINYLLLLNKKRKTFFFVILAVVIATIILNAVFHNSTSIIFSVIHILITFLTLRPYWAKMK